jgi:hypothetical protein
MPALMEAKSWSCLDLLVDGAGFGFVEALALALFADFDVGTLSFELSFVLLILLIPVLSIALPFTCTFSVLFLVLEDGFLEKKLKSVPCFCFGVDFCAEPAILDYDLARSSTYSRLLNVKRIDLVKSSGVDAVRKYEEQSNEQAHEARGTSGS